MAIAETAKLIASLELKDLFTKQVDGATKSLGKLDKSLDGTQSRAYKAGSQIGTGIKRGLAIAVAGIGLVGTQVALGVKSLEDLETVTAQTNAVLKSTKGVSGETAAGIRAMANEFEGLNATMDDTAIQSGANVLLTFTNIREKAFKPALQAALDLSTAMGQDLQSSVVQIGKALSNPVKGITALTRVGVTFTDQQKNQIKVLERSGKTYEAQKIILAELNKEFGGSFLAGGQTTAGKIAKVRDAIDDLQRALATALLPALGKVADATSKFLTDPKVVKAVSDLGQQIAGLFSDENLAKGAEVLQGMFQTAKDLAPIVESSAKATFTLVQAAVGLFKSLPPEIQSLAVGAFAINKLTGGLVTNIGGALIDLVGKSRGASPANPVFVSDVSAGLGGAAGAAEGGILGRLSRGLGDIVLKVAVVGMVAEVADLIHGVISPGGGLEGRTQSGNLLPADQLSWPFGPKNTPHVDLGPFKNIFGGDSAFTPPPTVPTTAGLPNPILDRGGREKGFSELAGKFEDDRVSLRHLVNAITFEFTSALHVLGHTSDPKKIVAAVKDLTHFLITDKRGGVEQTKAGLASLQKQLRNTHDPALQKVLRDAIEKVREKLPNREYAARQLAKAGDILKSGKTVEEKIKGLQAIERDLKDHKLPGQTRALQQKIDALKASQAHAIGQTTQAIKDKDLSLKLNVYNPVRVNINARQVAATNAIFSRYFGGTPLGTRAPRGG